MTSHNIQEGGLQSALLDIVTNQIVSRETMTTILISIPVIKHLDQRPGDDSKVE